MWPCCTRDLCILRVPHTSRWLTAHDQHAHSGIIISRHLLTSLSSPANILTGKTYHYSIWHFKRSDSRAAFFSPCPFKNVVFTPEGIHLPRGRSESSRLGCFQLELIALGNTALHAYITYDRRSHYVLSPPSIFLLFLLIICLSLYWSGPLPLLCSSPCREDYLWDSKAEEGPPDAEPRREDPTSAWTGGAQTCASPGGPWVNTHPHAQTHTAKVKVFPLNLLHCCFFWPHLVASPSPPSPQVLPLSRCRLMSSKMTSLPHPPSVMAATSRQALLHCRGSQVTNYWVTS